MSDSHTPRPDVTAVAVDVVSVRCCAQHVGFACWMLDLLALVRAALSVLPSCKREHVLSMGVVSMAQLWRTNRCKLEHVLSHGLP